MSTPAPGPRFTWKHAILLVVILAALVAIAIATAPWFTRSHLEGTVRSAGLWGPLLLLGLQIAQILIAPIPGVFVPILAGMLYGPVLGVAIATVGTALGSAAAFAIGRRAGLPLLRRWVGEKHVARAQALMGGKRWLALALIFLLPFTPSDAICFVAGLIGIRTSRFILAVLVGRLPKDAALALAGAGLIRLGSLVGGHS
ncbi:MAG TPA: VTT domain-containing protein [Candidatus Saccharimonadales bacterium]|nr:VTT domain-containing protein [Candidatus Saccharimonadales bacterium]